MKQSRQTDFAKEMLGEAAKQGNIKSLGKAVGLPDKDDWENICNMIDLYRKESVRRYGYDILVDCIATARKENAQYGGRYEKIAHGFNLVNKDSGMRYHFELPESFVAWIQMAYPLMFKEKTHYAWFCKNFKQLMIADRY